MVANCNAYPLLASAYSTNLQSQICAPRDLKIIALRLAQQCNFPARSAYSTVDMAFHDHFILHWYTKIAIVAQ